MSHLILIGFVIAVFFILPSLFLYLTINDMLSSRNTGREMDLIYTGITDFLSDLHVTNIANYDGIFSNWLEKTIPSLRSKMIQGSLRLLIEAKYIGLGEGHREKLSKDEEYRKNALVYTEALAGSFQKGDAKDIYLKLGKLYEHFMCMDIVNEENKANSTQHVSLTSRALLSASESLEKDHYLAKNELSDTLRKVVSLSSTEENVGMSLLLLQWALIKISQPHKPKPRAFINKSKSLSSHLKDAALHYKNNDLEGTIYAIIER